MKQSRSTSFLKSVISTGVGFGVSLLAQILILPLLGVEVRLDQNLKFAMIMTVISICRGYLLERFFEFMGMRVKMSPAFYAIAAERQRQKDVEGWDDAHDDAHQVGELAAAGSCYAMAPRWRAAVDGGAVQEPLCWPWDSSWWKPIDNRRDLVRAGALIVAELDRENRNRRRKAGAQ